uniref:Protein transport protein sec16 n=1 Tax=Caenorhabditis tropicalis TaxID=1561998 RepID=A0A1I7TH18_9PELO
MMMDYGQIMRRYKIDSMKHDQRMNGGVTGYNMNDWNQQYSASPPSSRNGEDEISSVTMPRPRRSRLDKDLPHTRGPMVIQPAAIPSHPSSSRRSNKYGNGNVHMTNGGQRGHNSTFNGYELSYKRYPQTSSRGPNESFSGIYSQPRNASGYASDYMNSRIGMIPNQGEPRRPRSTIAEQYSNTVPRNGFSGYDSGESGNSDELDEEEENEEVMRTMYLEARRAQGSRSVTNSVHPENYSGEDERYYFGVVKLGSQVVDDVFRTMPPPEGYFRLKPIERTAYIYFCAINKRPYQNTEEFRKIFNREYFNYVCDGDTEEAALQKICRRMKDEYTRKQLEASKLAYEKAQKEAAETEKLDFNKHRLEDPDDHKLVISQPEEVLSNGPLYYHSCLQFATIGVGGKIVIIRPAGTVDPVSGNVLSTTSVHVDDLRSLLHFDEQSGKVIESVQNFKGPLIAGQTPTHSVRLYIQRQIDALRQMRNSGDVKKSEVVDALLIWQLLEIMVQQHGRVTGPDIATLLTVASEELAEKTGVSEGGAADTPHKSEAKERFNKFLLGGHINEAVESAVSDGLYADAMTLIRRLHPNDAKKIEEIETRFMNLRSIDDPFATLVAVANDQLPPILTNSAFDDDNNWKRHAAIVLANLSSEAAMLTIYRLGLLLARRNRNCAADFCLLVVCILTGYDCFSLPATSQSDEQERSREYIGLVHSGSSLLNKIDGLSGKAGFAFTDLHATDIFDYALRLGNNNSNSPLAKSVDYQMSRIEYAKKLASYGGFATDAFRYCTEVARSLWMYLGAFDRNSLLDLCDLAESLQYVAATTPAEIEWIASMRMMLNGESPIPQEAQQQQEQPEQPPQKVENRSLSSEAQNWHNDHQAPIEITQKMVVHHQEEQHAQPPAPPVPDHHQHQQHHQSAQREPSLHNHQSPQKTPLAPPTVTATDSSSYESNKSGNYISTETTDISTSRTSTITESSPPPTLPRKEKPMISPPPTMKSFVPDMKPPAEIPPFVSASPQNVPQMTPPPPMTPPLTHSQPIPMATNTFDADVAKSPRTELEDLWGAPPPTISYQQPQAPAMSVPPPAVIPHQPPPASSAPNLMQSTHGQPSVPNTKTTAPPSPEKQEAKKNQNASTGWFGSIRKKLIDSLPPKQMILPDDKKPTIVWDEAQKRYVGAESVNAPPPPPPVLSPGDGFDSNKSSTNSLQNARSSGRSRYALGGMTTSQSTNTVMSSMMPPTQMPLPMSFNFVPSLPDDCSSDSVDPFSGEANPTVPESGSKQKYDQ